MMCSSAPSRTKFSRTLVDSTRASAWLGRSLCRKARRALFRRRTCHSSAACGARVPPRCGARHCSRMREPALRYHRSTSALESRMASLPPPERFFASWTCSRQPQRHAPRPFGLRSAEQRGPEVSPSRVYREGDIYARTADRASLL
eukprot:scaffold1115_cov390-Prasinococcus_capsulatus_cf.AAC.4